MSVNSKSPAVKHLKALVEDFIEQEVKYFSYEELEQAIRAFKTEYMTDFDRLLMRKILDEKAKADRARGV